MCAEGCSCAPRLHILRCGHVWLSEEGSSIAHQVSINQNGCCKATRTCPGFLWHEPLQLFYFQKHQVRSFTLLLQSLCTVREALVCCSAECFSGLQLGFREMLTEFSPTGAATSSLGTGQKWVSMGTYWSSTGSEARSSGGSTERKSMDRKDYYLAFTTHKIVLREDFTAGK